MPFKIYRSSAGSGKTFTLVKEYLRLALANNKVDNYRGILAITFTNKAAEEMKARVIEMLEILASEPHSEHAMAKILRNQLGLQERELATRSAKVLKHMLHHYADISISTIDHFTHKVIRTFAQDLGLSVNFAVELDTDDIKVQIADKLFESVGTDKVLTAALVDLAQSQTDEEKSWALDDKLSQFVNTLFSEESRFHLAQLKYIDLSEFVAVRKRLRNRTSICKKRLKEIGLEVSERLAQNGLTSASFYQGDRGILGVFNNARAAIVKDFNSYVTTTIEQDKWYSGKASPADKSAIDGLKPIVITFLDEILNLGTEIKLNELVFENIYSTALLEEMSRILQEIQQEDEMLHISEFNHVVSNVVMKESAPFIYERIGHRFQHFLVDEFQDTNVLQWFNLLPLIDESLAHDNLCLVVGDAKQSIYRWRGGDVQQFVELPSIHKTAYLNEKLNQDKDLVQLITQRENVLNQRAEVFNLDKNYRSSKTIVEFNNRLFERLIETMPEQFQSMYHKADQSPFRDTEGLVNLKFFQSENTAAYADQTLEQIRVWVDDCISDGYDPGDIAILFRGNKEAVATAQYLIENDYRVVSNESLLINSSPKVRLLVNLAVFLFRPDNSTNKAELIQHLGMVRKEENLTSSRLINVGRKGGQQELTDLLAELYPATKWKHLRRETLYSFFEHLIFGLFPSDNESHLRFFMDEVLSFNHTNGNDMLGYIDHWEEKRSKLSIALTQNKEAIRILTIHKSKGLEFPVVIHPFADYEKTSSKNRIWVYQKNKDLMPIDRLRLTSSKRLSGTPFEDDYQHESALTEMDMFNMLYVAVTRPKYRLYLVGKLKDENASDKSPVSAGQFVFDSIKDEPQFNKEENQYILGSNIHKEKTEEESPNYLKLSHTGDPFWMQRISISQPSTKIWKSDSAIDYGNLVHFAMAHITTTEDVDLAVNLIAENGSIPADKAVDLKKLLTNLLEKEELKDLFSKDIRVLNEADIKLENGKWLRPDRVVIKDDQAWIIDYKTGVRDPSHKQQVDEYKNAVSKLGYKHVKGMLVYLDTETVVEV